MRSGIGSQAGMKANSTALYNFLLSLSNEAAGVFGQIVAAVSVCPSTAAAANSFVIAFAANAF